MLKAFVELICQQQILSAEHFRGPACSCSSSAITLSSQHSHAASRTQAESYGVGHPNRGFEKIQAFPTIQPPGQEVNMLYTQHRSKLVQPVALVLHVPII